MPKPMSLILAAEAALRELRTIISDFGPCDHSVGICICETRRIADLLERNIKAARGEKSHAA